MVFHRGNIVDAGIRLLLLARLLSLLLFFVFFAPNLSPSSLASLSTSSTSSSSFLPPLRLLLPLCPFLPCLLRYLLIPHLLRSFWGITEIFLFQTLSIWFSHFYFFQTLMNHFTTHLSRELALQQYHWLLQLYL